MAEAQGIFTFKRARNTFMHLCVLALVAGEAIPPDASHQVVHVRNVKASVQRRGHDIARVDNARVCEANFLEVFCYLFTRGGNPAPSIEIFIDYLLQRRLLRHQLSSLLESDILCGLRLCRLFEARVPRLRMPEFRRHCTLRQQ